MVKKNPIDNAGFRDRVQAMVFNELSLRQAAMKKMLDGPNRDIDTECGYPTTISIQNYQDMFDREGIANRVVRCMPEESWQNDPEVYEVEEAEETEFETEVKAVVVKHNIFHHLQRADEISGIGEFGIILLGIDDGKLLSEPVENIDETGEVSDGNAYELLYIREFSQSVVQVGSRQTDISNPRYGKPLSYNITFQDTSEASSNGGVATLSQTVHWTRVIHLADNRVMSEVFGTPRQKPVWNREMDIRKILGGSGEMWWKGAFPGIAFEVNPLLAEQGIQLDSESVKEQMDLYSNGLQRYLAIQGMTAKPMAPQVADPKGHLEVQLQSVAITLNIPIAVLLGNVLGQSASIQEMRNWNKRLTKRQDKYLSPLVVRPFFDRLIAFGVLPKPAKSYSIFWPDLAAPTDSDKADIALKQTQSFAQYVGGNVSQLIEPESYLTEIHKMPVEVVAAIMEATMTYTEDKQTEEDAAAVEQAKELADAGVEDPNAPPPDPVAQTPRQRLDAKVKQGTKDALKAGAPVPARTLGVKPAKTR